MIELVSLQPSRKRNRGGLDDQKVISLSPRGKPVKKLPEELPLPSTATSSDLYTHLAASSRTSIHRLRITKGSDGTHIPNTASLPISETGLRDGSTIYVKDLGPQISWRLVYILEYLGPLLIHPFLYFLLPSPSPSFLQTLSCALITLHFLKRELETLFRPLLAARGPEHRGLHLPPFLPRGGALEPVHHVAERRVVRGG
ncbi:MAG: hypothetical protein Q9210_004391 [Variospora velana]